MENAIPPMINPVLATLDELQETRIEMSDEVKKERRIAQLGMADGWEDLKTYLMARVESLKHFSIMPDDSIEQIGVKAALYRGVETELLSIIELVETVRTKVAEVQDESRE